MKMMKLEKWHLEKGTFTVAWGVVYGHDRIADGILIHTSPVVSIDLDAENKRLEVKTETGNLYDLAFEDIEDEPISFEDTKDSLKRFDISTDFLNEAKILAEEKQHRELLRADSMMVDGDLLLEAAGAEVVRAYFKKEGKVHLLRISYHSGMFQDSVIIQKSGVADFRYFPQLDSMETYHISDGIKRLAIKNIGNSNIVLDNRIYAPDTLNYVCTVGYSYSEGLFSPDCVNGKSVLFTGNVEEKV